MNEIRENLIEHLTNVVHQLEEKISLVNQTHENLLELISTVSNTHRIILEDLNNMKIIFNDFIKSHQDKSNEQKENLTIMSTTSSEESSLTNENLPTVQKPSKSVKFSLDQNLHYEEENTNHHHSVKQFPKEKKNDLFPQITTPINPALSSEFVRENRLLIDPIVEQLTTIRIEEIEAENGDYLRLRNCSFSEDLDLTDHFLEQTIDSKVFCRFKFPLDTILQAGQTITIWCGRSKGIEAQPPHIFLWKEQRKWETKAQCLTILAKPNGQPIASFRNSHRLSTDQSSSDILHIHSPTNSLTSGPSRISSTSSNFNLKFHDFYGNRKPPFAHSTTNPIHPDYNATIVKLTNDSRSQMYQRKKYPQLLRRPKSSPFANYTGCKQDLISFNTLRRQQQQTTIFN